MDYILKGGSIEFERFKNDVNKHIPNLTKEWWDRVEVHLHGGIYRGQIEWGILEDEGEEEDVSKIVTLTAIIGFAYLHSASVPPELGTDLIHYIDDIHNRNLPENFRLPLDNGLFNRRRFIHFLDILLKHAERTKLYRSSLDIEMEGNLLKRQSSNYHERWDQIKDSQGNVNWVPKEGVVESHAPMRIPGFNIDLYEDPLETLTAIVGPDINGYWNIVQSVQDLSTRKMFVHLVFALKEFVTNCYQIDEGLDYKEMDYQVALKIVEEEHKQYSEKYRLPKPVRLERDLGEMMLPELKEHAKGLGFLDWEIDGDTYSPSSEDNEKKDLIKLIVDKVTLESRGQLEITYMDLFDGPKRKGGVDARTDYFHQWAKRMANDRLEAEESVIDSLLTIDKQFKLPDKYHQHYTPILISHLILYEKQQTIKAKINKLIYEQSKNFKNVSKEVISKQYEKINGLIFDNLFNVMMAWEHLYQRIYLPHMKQSSEYIVETLDIRFEQKLNSTELFFWKLYLSLRFNTTEYKDDLDLSPNPNIFKKAFARYEILKKKLEPSFSNPPLIVMPHLHEEQDGGTAERLEKFISNEELIYKNEEEYIHQLKQVEYYESKIQSLKNKGSKKSKSKSEDNPEYDDAVDLLKDHNQSANWMKGFLIDLVNSPQIANLVLYYEALIEDEEVGPDQLPFIREFKEKYKDDLSYLYDFEEVERGWVKSLQDKNKPDFTEENMIKTLKDEGFLDRILFINDDIKDSHNEVVPETEYAKYWPERKKFLDNILKKINQTVEDTPEPDLSELMKKGQGTYDPRQKNWLLGYTDLVNPIDELKDRFIKERRSKYATTTQQGVVGQQAAQKAKQGIDFHERAKGKTRLFDNLKKGQTLQYPPIIPKGMGTLTNRRNWKLPGTMRDKYKDYYMTNQFRSAARDRWGDNYLEDAPQEFLNAVDLEGTKDERLKAYKEAFQTIDLNEGNPLNEDEIYDEFVNTIQDIESRGKKGEKVRMAVIDKDGNPMLDSDDQRKPAEAYLPSNMMPLEADYGTLQFDRLENIADYKLPVKIGKTIDGEDVYQMKPFLSVQEPEDLPKLWEDLLNTDLNADFNPNVEELWSPMDNERFPTPSNSSSEQYILPEQPEMMDSPRTPRLGGGHHKSTKKKQTKKKHTKKKHAKKKHTKKKQTRGSKNDNYICYTGIGAKGNGTHTEKEFLEVMEKGGKNRYNFGSTPSQKKKAEKKNKELNNLEAWLEFSGAIKGKCKPSLLYYSKDNCNECKQFYPIWKQLEKDFKNEITMDHIQEKHQSKFILEKYNIKNIPAIIFIPLKDLNTDGPIYHFKGEKTRGNIENFIKRVL